MKNKPETIHARIVFLMEKHGLSQVALAKIMKIKQASVWSWTAGKSKPKNIIDLARALETTPEWLLTGKGFPKTGLGITGHKHVCGGFFEKENIRRQPASKAIHDLAAMIISKAEKEMEHPVSSAQKKRAATRLIAVLQSDYEREIETTAEEKTKIAEFFLSGAK